MGQRKPEAARKISDSTSLADLTKRLSNGAMERVVATLGERRVSTLRVAVLGAVTLWVMAWRFYGQQPVLVEDAQEVYPWALSVFLASVIWWIFIRFDLIRMKTWVDVAGTVANYLVIAVLTKQAFLLLITLEAVLPFLAIMIGAQYSRRWFKVGVAASLIVLLWSAPSGYWLSRPAYLVYAIVLTVGLPLLTGRIFSAVREISLQALEAMDAQNRFVGAMSHELRTPLNVIVNAIDMIDRDGMTNDQCDLLDLSEINARVLSRRVNSVLDITKHNAGGIKLNEECIDMRSLMSAVRDVNAPDALERGIAFRVDVADNVPPVLYGDQGRIEQVLSNLVSNAIKYTPVEGRVHVSLYVGAFNEERSVDLICTVADTGIGIPENEKVRIFDAFYQVSSGDTRMHGGVGLGLFIVRNVTEQLGGSLSIEDNVGGGTIFTWRVSIPMAEANVSSLRLSIPDLLLDHRARVAPLRCLVIDDHPANVDIMRRLLGKAGHEVSAACDGPDGLEAICNGKFDIVFLDLHMPGMSGWDVLDAIGRRPPQQWTPIIVLSADSDPKGVRLAISKGAAAFVSKPVSAKQLLETIMRVSGRYSDTDGECVESTPLEEMRQLGDGTSVGVLLLHVRDGLANGLHGVERALAADANEQAAYHLHGLRNEFCTLGFDMAAEFVNRLRDRVLVDRDITADMNQLKREVNQALAWIVEQPEYDAMKRI